MACINGLSSAVTRSFVVVVLVLLVLGGCALNIDERLAIPTSKSEIARGEYLTTSLAACGSCHGASRSPDAPLIGGLPYYDRYGEVLAPNLTWSENPARLAASNIVDVIRRGESMGEHISKQAHMGYQWMSDTDLSNIIAYIRSLPARINRVERRTLGTFEKYTWGAFETDFAVRGAVPEIKPRSGAAYGDYLIRHVARCSSCHNGPTGVFSGEDFLSGGKVLHNEHGTVEVPSLRGLSSQRGWTVDNIKNFLQTGRGPKGKDQAGEFCPTDFYARAQEKDLLEIAQFLSKM